MPTMLPEHFPGALLIPRKLALSENNYGPPKLPPFSTSLYLVKTHFISLTNISYWTSGHDRTHACDTQDNIPAPPSRPPSLSSLAPPPHPRTPSRTTPVPACNNPYPRDHFPQLTSQTHECTPQENVLYPKVPEHSPQPLLQLIVLLSSRTLARTASHCRKL